MKIFQIRTQIDLFQYFVPRIQESDGESVLEEDDLLRSLYIEDPHLRPTDFYNQRATYLITSPRATHVLHEHLEAAGRMKLFVYQDQTYAWTDITRYLDVLDEERSEFVV